LINDLATTAESLGHKNQASEFLKQAIALFADATDPDLVQAVSIFRDRITMAQVDVRATLLAFLQNKKTPNDDVIAMVDTLLKDSPGLMIFREVRQLAAIMETERPETAALVYEKFTAAFANHPMQEVAQSAQQTVDFFRRRNGLIGNPFTVSGVNIDGSPFDWNAYQGKVVLIDFWATWCVPCLQEIPNIRANYEKYRDKGFEVIGINLDDDPQVVRDQFFRLQKLPWPTVISEDPQKYGFANPLADKCGVESIPFLVLVGADGNVIAINVRGPALEEKLAGLFGESAAEPAAEPPGKPADS
jgi:thiol-disulfide isomerase/thioredoxin